MTDFLLDFLFDIDQHYKGADVAAYAGACIQTNPIPSPRFLTPHLETFMRMGDGESGVTLLHSKIDSPSSFFGPHLCYWVSRERIFYEKSK